MATTSEFGQYSITIYAENITDPPVNLNASSEGVTDDEILALAAALEACTWPAAFGKITSQVARFDTTYTQSIGNPTGNPPVFS